MKDNPSFRDVTKPQRTDFPSIILGIFAVNRSLALIAKPPKNPYLSEFVNNGEFKVMYRLYVHVLGRLR